MPGQPDALQVAQLERLLKLRELLAEKEEREKAAVNANVDPEKSAVRYYHDPVGFSRDCIDWGDSGGLTEYQEDVLGALPVKKRVAVRGPHGLGKSTTSAIAILWFAITRDAAGVDWKVASTAGAWRQLIRYLWPEIHKWAKRIKWEEVGRQPFDERLELLSLNIKLNHGSAFAVASSNPELIEGVHADSVLYVFDESKAIAAGTFEAAEGAFSGANPDGGLPEAFALACSTPGEPNGMFYDIHARRPGLEDWWARHVTLEEAARARRVSMVWADQRKAQWGEKTAAYQNRVLGEFYSSDEDGVIPLAWIEAAQERWRNWRDAGSPLPEDCEKRISADIARSGTDKTAIAIRYGDIITEIRKSHREDTMQSTGRIRGLLESIEGSSAIVDVIGIGAGVVDRLRELKMPVEAFNASQGTKKRDRANEMGFTNTRSAAWWNLRELLDPANNSEIMFPDDDLLTGDLTAPHWRIISGGRIQVEPKDDIKKRIGRSPDDGDAVVMAFWGDPGNWHDAYGTAYCIKCARAFVAKLHPDRCPFCLWPIGMSV
jgi:hypothetical protein